MGTLTIDGKNKILATLTPTTIILHNVDPTADPTANKVTQPVAIYFSEPDNGLIASEDTVNITVPASAMVSHYSLWDANDKCVATGALSKPQFFAEEGIYVISSVSVDLNK